MNNLPLQISDTSERPVQTPKKKDYLAFASIPIFSFYFIPLIHWKESNYELKDWVIDFYKYKEIIKERQFICYQVLFFGFGLIYLKKI